jgi:hypothetical protein
MAVGPQPASFAVGLFFLIATTIAALTYTYLDEVAYHIRFGIWPVLIGTGLLSLASSFLSRHLVLAPLSCFVPTIAADLLTAKLVSVAYAHLHACVPLAFFFSCPAFIAVLMLRRKRRIR